MTNAVMEEAVELEVDESRTFEKSQHTLMGKILQQNPSTEEP